MKTDRGLALMITAMIGAGIFTLPILAHQLHPILTMALIFMGFIFSVTLGYTILNFAPASIEEEVERILGEPAAKFIKIMNIAIILLALTSYAFGIQAHLKTNPALLLIFLFIPLFLNLTFPPTFSISLAIFILIYIALLSLGNALKVDLIYGNSYSPYASGLFLSAVYFAFFGHNMIPRIRNIVRKIQDVKEIVILASILIFFAYLTFTLTTAPISSTTLPTLAVSGIYPEFISVFVIIVAILIFYTSFILLSVHLQDEIGEGLYSSAMIFLIVTFLYFIFRTFSFGFPAVISIAGFCVSIYSMIIAVAGIKSKKREDLISQVSPYLLLVLSFLPWVLVVAG